MNFPILLQQLSDFLNARWHSEHMQINQVHILGMSGLLGMDWDTFHSTCCGCHALDLLNMSGTVPGLSIKIWQLPTNCVVKALNSAGYSPASNGELASSRK